MSRTGVSNRGVDQGLIAILGGFLLLGWVYAWATPPLEASDELRHYAVVWHLTREGGLPYQQAGQESLWLQEGSQPPVYYALAALLNAPLPLEDLGALVWENPHARIGLPHAVGNKNMLIHHPAFERSWAVLGMYLGRGLSLVLGSATVLLTWHLARVLLGSPIPAALAAGLVAFNPMFLFIQSSVNNDNLATFLATSTLAVALGMGNLWAGRWDERRRRRLLLVGTLAGLGALAKVSLLGLVPLLGLWVLMTEPGWRRRGEAAAWLSAGWGLVAAWWYGRNLLLYGELTGTLRMAQIAGLRPGAARLGELLGELEGLWLSFWGVFGGFNILAPGWMYGLYSLLSLAAVAGGLLIVVGELRRTASGRRPGAHEVSLFPETRPPTRLNPGILRLMPWTLLSLWPLILLAGLARWSGITHASQGRLIFPALPGLAILAAAGLMRLASAGRSSLRSRGGRRRVQVQDRVVKAALVVLAALALLPPAVSIRPAYAGPPRVAGLPQGARPLEATFADEIRLLGYELERRPVAAGDRIGVTLYLQHIRPSTENLSLFLHAFARGGPKLGQVDSYPGAGSLPTSAWAADGIIADRYGVPVERGAQGPAVVDLVVGVYDLATGRVFHPIDPQGRAAGEIRIPVGRLEVPTPHLEPQVRLGVTFGGVLELVGYDPPPAPLRAGEAAEIRLYWRRLGPLDRPLTTFVHLLNSGEAPLAQADSQPQDGRYPTDFWLEGEVVLDTKRLLLPADLAAGSYRLAAGAYDLQSGERLAPDEGQDPHRRFFLPSTGVAR